MEEALQGILKKAREEEEEEQRRPKVRLEYDESVSHLARDISARRRGVAAPPPASGAEAYQEKRKKKKKKKKRPAAEGGGASPSSSGRAEAQQGDVRTNLAVAMRTSSTPSLRFDPTP